jgi:membrane protein
MGIRTDASTTLATRPLASAKRPKHSLRQWSKLLKAAATAWVADYAPSMGAALSYYSVFSLAPLLLLVISIAGLVFGQDAVRGEVFGQLQGLLGVDASKAIEAVLASVSNKKTEGLVSTVIGAVVLLIGATTVFGELQDALDRIWRAPVRDRSGGVWALVRARLLSFGMILGIAFLLMVSLVLSAAVAALGKWWSGAFAGWEVLAQTVNAAVGFVMTTGVFALIYKIMPRVRVRWRDVWLGAAVTALLFTVGRFLIGLYIGKSGVASTFGAAGSLIVVFVWVYYSAQIFLIGAEFTWVYAKTFGSMRGLQADPVPKTPELIPVTESSVGRAVPAAGADAARGGPGSPASDGAAVAPARPPMLER